MRKGLFEFYSQSLPLGSVDFDSLAGMTEFYSCSDIKAICLEAASVPWREAMGGKETREIRQKDFELAVSKLSSTSLTWFESICSMTCAEVVRKRFSDMFDEIEQYEDFIGKSKRTGKTGPYR